MRSYAKSLLSSLFTSHGRTPSKKYRTVKQVFAKISKTSILINILSFSILFAFVEKPVSAEEQQLDLLKEKAYALNEASEMAPIVEKAREKELVLLGEASHGTSEYYLWRKKLSRKLIEQEGFSFIVVEGDWPSCYAVNLYVKGKLDESSNIRELLIDSFQRWPRWMWANEEIVKLAKWLKEHNKDLPTEEKVGFYGMDVYSLKESIFAVKEYLSGLENEELSSLKDKYKCFERFNYDGMSYGQQLSYNNPCKNEVTQVYEKLKEHSEELSEKDPYAFFNAKMNALLVKNAENYYRVVFTEHRGPSGWNNRVFHMEEVVENLFDHYGEGSKGILWAHNTHVGDARATTIMPQRGQVNIGQLKREKYGEENVFIVGFGTYKGTVMAGREWGAQQEVMEVPEAIDGSIEKVLSRVGKGSYFLLLDEADIKNIDALNEMRGNRAIGVVYNPQVEHMGNYVPTKLSERYDAFIFFEETETLTPLER